MIDGIVSRLADTYSISSIDLKDAFGQIELDSKFREMTAFTVPGRPLYQFRRMPFGLSKPRSDYVSAHGLRDSVPATGKCFRFCR